MTNKQELQEQVEKLQKELDILKSQIDNTDKIDLFKITTYKQVCKALNEKEYKLSDFNNDEKLLAFAQLKQIETLYCQNWIKDWKNTNQYKYYPYFTINSSGRLVFDLSLSCGNGFVGTVGFFPDEKTSTYVGKTFIDIYEKLK